MKKTRFRRVLSLLLALALSSALALPAAAEEETLTGLNITLASVTMTGKTATLTPTVTPVPEGAALPEKLVYAWTLDYSDNDLLGMDHTNARDLVVTAKKSGEASIKLSVTGGGFSADASCTVTVPSVSIPVASVSVDVRKSVTVTATYFGTQSLTWSTTDATVASVSGSGTTATVTGVRDGETTLTVREANGSVATCVVNVNAITPNDINGGSIAGGSALSFSGLYSSISSECSRVTGSSLSYVTGLQLTTAGAGTLYYAYVSEATPGYGVGMQESYYPSASGGTRAISDVSFVAASDFSGAAVIRFNAYAADGSSFQGKINITVSSSSGISYSTSSRGRVDFLTEDFRTVCRSKTSYDLQYVTFTLPSSSKGTLYYNYSGSDLDNKAEGGAPYYPAKSPSIERLTFVPAEDYSGTVSIRYSGRSTNNTSFSGTVNITVSRAEGGSGNISYTTGRNRAVHFDADDFNEFCRQETNRNLRYVRFTLPASSEGALYYNYSSSSSYDSRVSASTNYYRSSSYYLDRVAFVPASGFTGEVDIDFTGVSVDGDSISGVVSVSVDADGDSILTYTTSKNKAVRFSVDDFNDFCEEETGQRLNYVRFTLPSSSRGTLYYNYSASASSNTGVTASTNYYRSGSPYLSNVWFVPASDYTGTLSIDFTGRSTDGDSISGEVTVRVGVSSGATLAYTTNQNTALRLRADDFNSYCDQETGESLRYVRFTLPSSAAGVLYYDYTSPYNYDSLVSASTSYYRSSSPNLDRVWFVPASGYNGTVNVGFTGWSADNDRFTGTVKITVGAGTANTSSAINLTTSSGVAIPFQNAAFQTVCAARGGGSLVGISFSVLPSAAVGQMRYQYVSESQPGTAAAVNAYYRTAGAPMLTGLSFVPASTFSGSVTIPYSAVDSNGATYSGSINITVNAPYSAAFSDLAGYGWAAPAIESLAAKGVIQGTGNGKFSPGASITRGSFMLMLCRAYGFNSAGGGGFSDVATNSVYANAVLTAQALGIAQGSNGRFYPAAPLSRQQAAVFLTRAMRASGQTVNDGLASSLSAFKDAGSVSPYAAGPLSAMVQLNVFQGNSSGRLNPQSPLTRAQMAVILDRALSL